MYVVVREFAGKAVGDVIPIRNRTRAAALQRQGFVVPAEHSMVSTPAIDIGLLYRLATMTVSDLTAAISDIDDTAVLRAVLEHDSRAGARLAVDGRLALIPKDDDS